MSTCDIMVAKYWTGPIWNRDCKIPIVHLIDMWSHASHKLHKHYMLLCARVVLKSLWSHDGSYDHVWTLWSCDEWSHDGCSDQEMDATIMWWILWSHDGCWDQVMDAAIRWWMLCSDDGCCNIMMSAIIMWWML